MTDSLPYYLNRAMDVAAIASFFTKSFTIYVVIVHTPKKMRHFANLILMGLLWNFLGNLLFTFGHIIPMFPAECVRIDGILSAYFKSELIGHLFIKIVALVILNTALAILLSFQFRYMSVVHCSRIAKLHPAWGYLYCLIVYIAVFALYTVMYDNWSIRVTDYPDQNRLPLGEYLMCYKPHGVAKSAVIGCFIAIISVMVFGIAFFSKLSLHHLNQKHPGMHENTCVLQKRLLRNLLYLTVVPIFFGGIPVVIVFITLYFNEINEARVIFSICMVILLNYGVIYSITTLMVFKNYRITTKKILIAVVRRIFELKPRIGKNSIGGSGVTLRRRHEISP